ncbi:MAG: DcrB-related protein [Sandaracinaceae bacterium]
MSDRNSIPPGPQATTITTCGDLALSKPAGWVDKSMVILSAPPVDGKFPPSVVINRATLPKDHSTSDYAELCAKDGAEEFDGFELLDSDPASVDGGTAPAFRFRWDSPRGRATHRQVYLPGSEGTVLCVTLTSLPHSEAATEPLFERLLASIQAGAE